MSSPNCRIRECPGVAEKSEVCIMIQIDKCKR